jgi:hypothetical protein
MRLGKALNELKLYNNAAVAFMLARAGQVPRDFKHLPAPVLNLPVRLGHPSLPTCPVCGKRTQGVHHASLRDVALCLSNNTLSFCQWRCEPSCKRQGESGKLGIMRNASFPNLPGTYASGPFRLRLGKFHGQRTVTLVYKDELIATFDTAELVDLQEVVQRMEMFVTEESFAKLPPDED